MRRIPPQAVIHINFLPEVLLFEPRRVWTALGIAEAKGTIKPGIRLKIENELGQTAIWLAQRDYVLRTAHTVLKDSLKSLSNRIPDPWGIPEMGPGGIRYKVVSGNEIFRDRENVLLAVDSLFFEFRAYLELLAKFVFGILVGIDHTPPDQETLLGSSCTIVTKRGKVIPHNFILYLCSKLSLRTTWFDFLVQHRNFFTHEGTPYIAIEDRLVRPPEIEFIIMRVNITDFAKANPEDYFRLSEFTNVVQGLKDLTTRTQAHLIGLLEG